MENTNEKRTAHIIKATTRQEPGHPLVEPSLFYAPPYEHPLEDEFAWHLVKYLNADSGLGYQVKVRTPVANLWIDFIIEYNNRRVGIECTGLYEDETELNLRDALIVGSGAVDTLYRLRGIDVMYRLHDCLYLVSRWDTELFSRRGLINLNILATPRARDYAPRPDETFVKLEYNDTEEQDAIEGETFTWPEQPDEAKELHLRRLNTGFPSAWLRDYDRALAHFGASDDDLGEQWAKSA